MFYIYKITNTINGKIYIGKAKNIERRIKEHFRKAKFLDTYISKAILKYGKESFIVEQIDSAETESEIYLKEEFWIEKLNSTDSYVGYNITKGGKGGKFGLVISKETRLKISESQPKKLALPIEIQEKNIKAHKYKKDNVDFKNKVLEMYKTFSYTHQQIADYFKITLNETTSILKGAINIDKFEQYVMSDEERKKLSERIVSDETRKKISAVHKGKVVSQETRDKLSKSQIGRETGPQNPEYKQRATDGIRKYYQTHEKPPVIMSAERLQKSIAALNRKGETPNELKIEIIKDYETGNFTKKQLSEKYNLNMNKIVYIVGHCRKNEFMFLSEEEKHAIRSKSHSNRIKLPYEIQLQIVIDNNSGNYTRKQLGEKYNLKTEKIKDTIKRFKLKET